MSFFLEARSNYKITLIKTKYIVIYGKNNGGNNGCCVWEKVKVTHNGLKMLETIITEAIFVLSGSVSFTHFNNYSPQGKREAISLTPHGR